jgi:hypothetical protein
MRFFLAKALLLVSTTVLAAPASLAESEELGVCAYSSIFLIEQEMSSNSLETAPRQSDSP